MDSERSSEQNMENCELRAIVDLSGKMKERSESSGPPTEKALVKSLIENRPVSSTMTDSLSNWDAIQRSWALIGHPGYV
jgi:hypothetical protein